MRWAVAWIATRPNASWRFAGLITLSVLAACVITTVREFTEHGFTAIGVVIALSLFWLAYKSAEAGVASFHLIEMRRETTRRAPAPETRDQRLSRLMKLHESVGNEIEEIEEEEREERGWVRPR